MVFGGVPKKKKEKRNEKKRIGEGLNNWCCRSAGQGMASTEEHLLAMTVSSSKKCAERGGFTRNDR
jgi:hypothetical protein